LAICLNRKCVYTNLYYLFENHLFQDDYLEALSKLNLTVTKAYAVNPNIKFEVFIHKVDGLSDDTKMETQRDIHQRATDELAENELETQIHLTFYLVTPSQVRLSTKMNMNFSILNKRRQSSR
jgi:hypothetical protein